LAGIKRMINSLISSVLEFFGRRVSGAPRIPNPERPSTVDTKIVCHYFRGMLRNVTIVLEEKVADWARVEAAKRRTSLSRMVGEMLAEMMRQEETYEEAMRQFLDLKPERLRRSQNDKLPSRNETYQDARRLRG